MKIRNKTLHEILSNAKQFINNHQYTNAIEELKDLNQYYNEDDLNLLYNYVDYDDILENISDLCVENLMPYQSVLNHGRTYFVNLTKHDVMTLNQKLKVMENGFTAQLNINPKYKSAIFKVSDFIKTDLTDMQNQVFTIDNGEMTLISEKEMYDLLDYYTNM